MTCLLPLKHALSLCSCISYFMLVRCDYDILVFRFAICVPLHNKCLSYCRHVHAFDTAIASLVPHLPFHILADWHFNMLNVFL